MEVAKRGAVKDALVPQVTVTDDNEVNDAPASTTAQAHSVVENLNAVVTLEAGDPTATR